MSELKLQNVMLLGEASHYKGSRNYIHGTSLISEIEKTLQDISVDYNLTEIYFRRPLHNIGIVLIGREFIQDCDMDLACASGVITCVNKNPIEFVISETPIKIANSVPFNEAELNVQFSSKLEKPSVNVDFDPNFSFCEHVSISMKHLCQQLFPNKEHWFWATFSKNDILPPDFKKMSIQKEKIVINRFVSAQIFVDDLPFGSCVFVVSSR